MPADEVPIAPGRADGFGDRVRAGMSLSIDELPSDARLVDDLAFDSIGLLELFTVIEDAYGVYVGDLPDDIGAMTMHDLHRAVRELGGHD